MNIDHSHLQYFFLFDKPYHILTQYELLGFVLFVSSSQIALPNLTKWNVMFSCLHVLCNGLLCSVRVWCMAFPDMCFLFNDWKINPQRQNKLHVFLLYPKVLRSKLRFAILSLLSRLAQLVERKTLNLVVVGSSPTVGVLFAFSFFFRAGSWLV